ncbi:polymorphic toxin type 44 domain-containing protein [Kitasatospora sp. NBC_00070]|uniref:polymorphic toxin type 44 domain-containing protein n=1 Tax=Kitasatospora sp. NBC_00070 TaxID=2975962 RepID=UPI00325661EB
MRYEDLHHADLKALDAAADSWEQAAKRLRAAVGGFSSGTVKPLSASDWRGDAAVRAFNTLSQAEQELDRAANEAARVQALLADVHAQFTAVQKELRTLAESEAPAVGVRIAENGQVSPRDPLDSTSHERNDPDFRDAQNQQNQAVQQVEQRLAEILGKADRLDAAADQALRQDLNSAADRGFNADSYTKLDQVRNPSEQNYQNAGDFIFDEMKTNIESPDFKSIRDLYNTDDSFIGILTTPTDKLAALAKWALKVGPGQDWDHKPKLQDRLDLKQPDDFYFQVPGTEDKVFYDIYSNIHYGYVGTAAGFGPDTLIKGATVPIPVLVGKSDPGDVLTMQAGIDLWKQYGKDLTKEQLDAKIREVVAEMKAKHLDQVRPA